MADRTIHKGMAAVCAAPRPEFPRCPLGAGVVGRAMTRTDTRTILAAATDSFKDIHNLRDFVIAVVTGGEVAIKMLDDIEAGLMRILRTVDED